MEMLMDAAIGIAVINSIILLGLVYLYARIAVKSRAAYSFGLLFFAVMLLLQNLLTEQHHRKEKETEGVCGPGFDHYLGVEIHQAQ